MSDEQINVAIAELCGFGAALGESQRCTCLPPERDGCVCMACRGFIVPDYANNLNACHEFENTMYGQGIQAEHYVVALQKIAFERQATGSHRPKGHAHSLFVLANATARQRCEAFLRTLGKWQP